MIKNAYLFIFLNGHNYCKQTYILMIKNALFTYFSKWSQLPQADVYINDKECIIYLFS